MAGVLSARRFGFDRPDLSMMENLFSRDLFKIAGHARHGLREPDSSLSRAAPFDRHLSIWAAILAF